MGCAQDGTDCSSAAYYFRAPLKERRLFLVTVNKTIRDRLSWVLGMISFKGSAYQCSLKVWKDCKETALE